MQKLRVKRDSVILARGWLVSSAVGHRDVVASYSPEGWLGRVGSDGTDGDGGIFWRGTRPQSHGITCDL